uniref:Glycosyltransferase n=1 Tax=viral metagenome TaxID=1070528 RepID=A0A6C0E8Q8_9ZZZZ
MASKIEENLNVICVISNPCNYKRRIELANIFIAHMNNTKNVKLYIVECIYPKYGQTEYKVTESGNPCHLQLTAETILWTKENMINLGVQKLLPKDYKAFAFVDADLHFNNNLWAEETLNKLLTYDVLQVFETGYNLNKMNQVDEKCKMLYSYCYLWKKINREHNADMSHVKHKFRHQGWGWAMTRKAYEKMGGLYDLGILGGGDTILAKSLTAWRYMYRSKPYVKCSDGFVKSLYDYQIRCIGLNVDYVSGSVYHYYHGSLTNRKYIDRWNIIIGYGYNPYTFLTRNACGMYTATSAFPIEMQKEIIIYFKERDEDN